MSNKYNENDGEREKSDSKAYLLLLVLLLLVSSLMIFAYKKKPRPMEIDPPLDPVVVVEADIQGGYPSPSISVQPSNEEVQPDAVVEIDPQNFGDQVRNGELEAVSISSANLAKVVELTAPVVVSRPRVNIDSLDQGVGNASSPTNTKVNSSEEALPKSEVLEVNEFPPHQVQGKVELEELEEGERVEEAVEAREEGIVAIENLEVAISENPNRRKVPAPPPVYQFSILLHDPVAFLEKLALPLEHNPNALYRLELNIIPVQQ
jgi:hypothetical protein